MLEIIIIFVNLVSIYWFLKLISVNSRVKNHFGITVISNKTIKTLGFYLITVWLSEYAIVLQDWNKPIGNLQLIYYDFMLMGNFVLIVMYKKIVNSLDKLSKITN